MRRAPFGATRVPFLPAASIFQEVCSMYQALYRKWRPKVFSDVIGQEHITETLKAGGRGRTSPRLSVHRHKRYLARPPVPKFWPRPSTVSTR